MNVITIMAILSGFLIGCVLTFLAAWARMRLLKTNLEQEKDRNRELLQNKIELEKELSVVGTQLEMEQKKTEETVGVIKEAKDSLKTEFKNVANEIFEEKRVKFIDQSKDSLSNLIDPLKVQIKEFEKTVTETYEKEGRERFSLQREVEQLHELNMRLSEDADNLTKALKGDSKTQGTWGELILERILEESGLVKGREYVTQGGFRDEDNKLLKPDVIVRLPDKKDVVIDSKVSLTAYEEYVKADTDEEREVTAKAHLTSINSHLKGLSKKSYENLPDLRSLDFVLMFIPIESAFILAIEKETDIFSKAFQQKVMMVSPTTLLITLRTIQNIWRYEYQTKNAQEIARQAGGLYDKFAGFVSDLEEVGKHIGKTQAAYEGAYNKLSSGRGNLIGRAEKLKELGVKSKKSIQSGSDHQDMEEH